ncbi:MULTISPECIES: hypothetical protein [unclassified Glutamicibacter]|uniref:hypothetical protein n=1 Tax=unclassified Glutamicibacter TaxID=2627139 RepID=UPI003820CBAF
MGAIVAGLQWLNDVLVTQESGKFDENGNPTNPLSAGIYLGAVAEQMNCVTSACLSLRQQEEVGEFGADKNVRMYRYSVKPNFGDCTGPQMVEAYSGRQPFSSQPPSHQGSHFVQCGIYLGLDKSPQC